MICLFSVKRITELPTSSFKNEVQNLYVMENILQRLKGLLSIFLFLQNNKPLANSNLVKITLKTSKMKCIKVIFLNVQI